MLNRALQDTDRLEALQPAQRLVLERILMLTSSGALFKNSLVVVLWIQREQERKEGRA